MQKIFKIQVCRLNCSKYLYKNTKFVLMRLKLIKYLTKQWRDFGTILNLYPSVKSHMRKSAHVKCTWQQFFRVRWKKKPEIELQTDGSISLKFKKVYEIILVCINVHY